MEIIHYPRKGVGFLLINVDVAFCHWVVRFKHPAHLTLITRTFLLHRVAQLFSEVQARLSFKLNHPKFQVPFLLLWDLDRQVPRYQYTFATVRLGVFGAASKLCFTEWIPTAI